MFSRFHKNVCYIFFLTNFCLILCLMKMISLYSILYVRVYIILCILVCISLGHITCRVVTI